MTSKPVFSISDGYRILVADINEDAVDVHRTDLTQRTALVFGNELDGVPSKTRHMADAGIAIPMSGFADSFNISVGAAITLYEARRQRERRFGSNGDLSESDLARMRAVWYLKSVRESDLVVRRGLAERHGPAGTV